MARGASSWGMGVPGAPSFWLFLLVALWPAAASAHELNVFATAEAATIRGKATFHGDMPGGGLKVTALDSNMREIGQATTNNEGEFAFEARYCCDHRILVETPDGHGAACWVTAAQLASDLPEREGARASTDARPSITHTHAADGHSHEPASGDIATLRAEVVALREQLAGYENRTRLRDVLGGIGYILGLAGLAFYFLGVRRKEWGA